MKKVIVCVYILMFLVGGKLAFDYCYNEMVIDDYNNEEYSSDMEAMKVCNYVEEYIAYYNQGNLNYQNGLFSEAITEYEKALECKIPEGEECDVRINLALSKIKTLPEDYASQENVQSTIETLTEARDVLLVDDCATAEGDGHSETAEKLKKEIEDLIEQLKKQSSSEEETEEESESEEEESSESEEETTDSSAYEEEIKNQLKEQLEDAYNERTEQLDWYENMDEINFDANGRVW